MGSWTVSNLPDPTARVAALRRERWCSRFVAIVLFIGTPAGAGLPGMVSDFLRTVCAQLRAELVRLGRVDEHGVPLSQGTMAGVGDLVQARWNGWDLAGYEGNRRGPINRET